MREFQYFFLLFIIYSALGWIYESTLCSIANKKIINRGFLNGPICPIYGFGATLVIITLGRSENIFSLFLSSIFLTGVLEYFTSYAMERLFDAKWWDYSERKYNVNGRVCLEGALVFGSLSVLTVFIVNPFIEGIILGLSTKTINTISILSLSILIFDYYVTLKHISSLNNRLEKIQEAINRFTKESKEKTEEIKNTIKDKFEESEYYSDTIKKLIKNIKVQDGRILRAFPKLKSLKYSEAFERIKEELSKFKKN